MSTGVLSLIECFVFGYWSKQELVELVWCSWLVDLTSRDGDTQIRSSVLDMGEIKCRICTNINRNYNDDLAK